METRERVNQVTTALKELGDRRRPAPTLEEIRDRLDDLLPDKVRVHKGRVRVQMTFVWRDGAVCRFR